MDHLFARQDLFQCRLPKTFFPEEVVERYRPYLERMPNVITTSSKDTKIHDVINESIQSVSIPVMAYEPAEDIKNEGGVGKKKLWRSSIHPVDLFEPEFKITFTFLDGFINYWILLETLMHHYDYNNRDKFVQDIPVRILDGEGSVMFSTIFTQCLFKGLSEFELSYDKNTEEFSTFEATFAFNHLAMDFTPIVGSNTQ